MILQPEQSGGIRLNIRSRKHGCATARADNGSAVIDIPPTASLVAGGIRAIKLGRGRVCGGMQVVVGRHLFRDGDAAGRGEAAQTSVGGGGAGAREGNAVVRGRGRPVGKTTQTGEVVCHVGHGGVAAAGWSGGCGGLGGHFGGRGERRVGCFLNAAMRKGLFCTDL